ncbi:RNA polymerase sigma factor FliA [Ketobacter sp. MCCC 1A13808]|uniref:RNA polymerase sigma factor FliA n=1 Tax=Ketobacter sp. MCCC 1A13808 TaxID=2602738 RepID=UPI000F170B8A|nr:RNA polymerase sigma factor FliA [Ketobacter sp. MCCC 1A13808]RLP56516.1 MAG: RNA polymerase sigma factor FliA [Ketobacter sp.]
MYNDKSAPQLDAMVEQYTPLVRRIAHHLMGRMPSSVAVEDLYQAGLIGLLDAIKRFDNSKGASFETYAGIRIRGAMVDDVRKGEWAPRSVHRNARRIQEAIRSVENRTGADAHDRDIANELGISLNEYHAMLQDSMATRLFSLDEMESPDDFIDSERQQEQSLNPFEELQHGDFRNHLAKAIEQLSEREQLVISLYYDEELNLKEIGEVLGVSESRVSQIHSQAAQRLRTRLQEWL